MLYPALHRLERKGFVEEEWGPTETGREAKFYRLTPAGRSHLRAEVVRWKSFTALMDTALAAPRGP